MNSLDRALYMKTATQLIAGIVVPHTPTISRAIDYVRAHSEPYLFNHAMRSWLFAVAIMQARHVKCDGEVLAVATLLHDLGLTKGFVGPLRFEVEGANAARAFANAAGMNTTRAQLIWDGVALNSTPSLALYKEPEVAVCTLGIGLDWAGAEYETLTEKQIAAIVDEYPRLDMKQRFTNDVCGIVESRAESTYDNFAGDFGERFVPNYKRRSSVDALFDSPFKE